MARITHSRRSTGLAGFAALLVMAALALAGCGNDNPADSGGTMTVDLRGLVSSMGGGSSEFSTSAVGVADSPATTAVKSLIIGAVVITFTDDPLSGDTNIDGDVADDLAADVINSINYFSIVDLPTSEDFVEFKVPPPGAGKWQVAAIGTRDQIVTYQDLDNENVGIYYGFSSGFLTTSSGSVPDVTLDMKRACFIDDPPKGCAAYDVNGDAIVTPSVRILTVYNGGSNTGTGVINVNGPGDVAAAVAALEGVSYSSGDTLTVVQTHPDAPDYATGSCSSPPLTNGVAIDDACAGTAVTDMD